MTSHRQSNEAKAGRRARPERPSRGAAAPIANPGQRRRAEDAGAEWLWGWHAVVAAMDNPMRQRAKRLLATRERANELGDRLDRDFAVEILTPAEIGQLVPSGAVHQGLALRVPLLEPTEPR